MMRITISHRNQKISLELERNVPEREAFEALSAFSLSAFENLPEDLVFTYAGPSGETFQLQDPREWRVFLDMVGDVNDIDFTILNDMSVDSEDESFEIIDGETIGVESASESSSEEGDLPEMSIENYPADEGKVVEPEPIQQNSTKQVEDLKKPVATEQPAEETKTTEEPPLTMKQRFAEFLQAVGAEDMQNITVVLHSLLTDGHDLPTAIRLAHETSEAAMNHPFVQTIFSMTAMFAPMVQNWIPMMIQHFDPSQIVAMIPQIIEAISKAAEGEEHVELDIRNAFPPEVIANLERFIPNGEERVFSCVPGFPFSVIDEATDAVEAEFGPIHHNVTCDVCGQSPIVGARYKCTVRPDFDLCEKCEPEHNNSHPMIKMYEPLTEMRTPGIWEFMKAVGRKRGGRHGGPRGFCGGRRGGRRCGRGRGGRHCGGKMFKPCHMMKKMKHFMSQMHENPLVKQEMENHFNRMKQKMEENPHFQEKAKHCFEKMKSKMKENGCFEEMQNMPCFQKMQQHFEEQNVSNSTSDVSASAPPADERAAELLSGIEALKQEAKQCRKELKQKKKEKKQLKKELKKVNKEAKKIAKTRFASEVVAHLDLEEESTQVPGTYLLKTWKVKNTGTVTWSPDTIATFKKGAKQMVTPDSLNVMVGAVAPGEVTYIRAMFAVPEETGKYKVVFRLQAPDAGKFGEPMKTFVTVEAVAEPEPEPVVEPEPEPSAPAMEQKFEFEEQLAMLCNMGFDAEQSKAVLLATGGNVEAAFELLL